MNFRIAWLLMRSRVVLLSAMLFVLNLNVWGEVRLPYILSDNMVLQRRLPVNVWGWARPGERVSVTFNNQKVSAKAAKDGTWKVQLAPLAAGGPFEMTINGKNAITLKNILVGDVWVCGGQSNMERWLSMSRNWDVDQNSVENQNIRLFNLPKNISTTPLDNTLEAKWEICGRETAARFSAVGYYFGKNLEKELNVPIGLINDNWGGTGIETWTSLETMYVDDDYKAAVDKVGSIDTEQIRKEAETNKIKYQNTVDNDDPGIINKWYAEAADVSEWKTMKLPKPWEEAGLPSLDGVVWFSKEITVSPEDAGKEAIVSLGTIDDSDVTWLNGVQIGKTENKPGAVRLYKVPPGVLVAGKNRLTVKVIDRTGRGGLWGKEEELFVEFRGKKIGLADKWLYKVGLNLPAFKDVSNPNTYPSLLYNGMINPIIKYPIKGAIWYQGENNVGRHIKYRSQFPAMIKDWRQKWNCGEFTFLFVQLANFTEPVQEPQNSPWAGLREAQTMALTVPNTGMAVTIDIGEAKDIHPRNKDDVGYRLALAALKKTYGRELVYSGPIYKSMKVEGDRVILEFDFTGSGLMAKDKYGYLKSFAIAGADKKFVWAKASLTPDNKVIVIGEGVRNPVAVRYAWANNPDDANLYNKEGLPASPFRTDDW